MGMCSSILEHIPDLLWMGACVVMDNLSAHLDKIEICAVEAKLVYLPLFRLTSIPENCWSKCSFYGRLQLAASIYI